MTVSFFIAAVGFLTGFLLGKWYYKKPEQEKQEEEEEKSGTYRLCGKPGKR